MSKFGSVFVSEKKEFVNVLFRDISDIRCTLTNFYENEFDLEFILECVQMDTPWNLLKIFMCPSFNVDFSDKFRCENSSILWHLQAISNALEKKSIDLIYGDFFSEKFNYSTSDINFGQGKLFYSLLYFCLDSQRMSYDKIYEVGAGEKYGGENHVAVCNVLGSSKRCLNFELLDPLQNDGYENIAGCNIDHKFRTVHATDEYSYPVFCDIYDGRHWDELQRNLQAPLKMLKAINIDKDSRYVFHQPYHTEKRIYQSSQFVFFLRSFSSESAEFDNCLNCLLWKALMLEFAIDSVSLMSQLLWLGLKSCKAFAGAGYISVLKNPEAEKNVKVVKTLDVKQKMYVFSKRPTLTSKKERDIQFVEEALDRYGVLVNEKASDKYVKRSDLIDQKGVSLYHTVIHGNEDEIIFVFSKDDKADNEAILCEQGYVLIDKVKNTFVTVCRYVSSTSLPFDVGLITIEKLMGYQCDKIYLKCRFHEFCFGPKCGDSDYVILYKDNCFKVFLIHPNTCSEYYKVKPIKGHNNSRVLLQLYKKNYVDDDVSDSLRDIFIYHGMFQITPNYYYGKYFSYTDGILLSHIDNSFEERQQYFNSFLRSYTRKFQFSDNVKDFFDRLADQLVDLSSPQIKEVDFSFSEMVSEAIDRTFETIVINNSLKIS